MLEHTAVNPEGIQRSRETPAIVPQLELMWVACTAVPKLTPAAGTEDARLPGKDRDKTLHHAPGPKDQRQANQSKHHLFLQKLLQSESYKPLVSKPDFVVGKHTQIRIPMFYSRAYLSGFLAAVTPHQ
jgi:hypothetical protein